MIKTKQISKNEVTLKGWELLLSFPPPALPGSGCKGMISACYFKAPRF